MLKNLRVYQIEFKELDFDMLPEFVSCGPTQMSSSGFVPPRAAHGALVESISEHWVLKLQTETKVLPSDAVKRRTAEVAARIERDSGRKPGKKFLKEIKEEVILDLLPKALTRMSSVWILIDRRRERLIVGTTSTSRLDEVISMLIKSLNGLVVKYVDAPTAPHRLMAQWLLEGVADGEFDLGRECELRGDNKAVIKYGRHEVDIDEIREHIKQGMQVSRLALTYDGRLSFVMSDNAMEMRKLDFLELAMQDMDKDGDAFDASVTLAGWELRRALDAMQAVLAEDDLGL